ncbi:coenzyme F420-0:L-glutamate ligase [Caldilinea sp.]|uniref:coenzyme F420-0:L-glutamate ligase n=1 Tax=Caldilinea sp. TaxID=2293560 RepID=UPI002C192490|nr:coenzyme F420-0:L-glutamate ligase [Caldilinea sp.]HRA67533.1 coenzyme F420-0:L-glutamate ligase [Caldilinea sp.]
MHIQPLTTRKITTTDRDLFAILDQYLTEFNEGEILAIASKIVALCQGRTIPMTEASKAALIEAESTYFLPATLSRYEVYLTIKAHALMPFAGIDESNSDGQYVLWPQAPQAAANAIRGYLQQRFGLHRVGVIITDSRPLPLRWGVTGFTVAHSGFLALYDYRGQSDLFGRPLQMTQANVADALAAAAVLVMGEGSEQTPLARIAGAPFVEFQNRDPTPEELAALVTSIEDDLYAPLLNGVAWQRGKG